MFHNVIQIAGIIDRAEADLLMAAGVDFLGFPLRLAVNREDLSEARAAEIIKTIHEPHRAVLITYLSDALEIIRLCELLAVRIVQLHGAINISELKKIRRMEPQLKVIKSLVVRADNTTALMSELEMLSEYVDAFITDTFDPVTGATGATGRTHDWSISHLIVESSSRPVILAGGLNSSNVYKAIMTVQPDGVDAHTGVEAERGRKDRKMVSQFVQEARRGFMDLENPDPLAIPVDGILDLHTFQPGEVKTLVPEYLRACHENGLSTIRIIHGKGTGTLRRIVHSILSESPFVESYETADSHAGGWGATSVILTQLNHK